MYLESAKIKQDFVLGQTFCLFFPDDTSRMMRVRLGSLLIAARRLFSDSNSIDFLNDSCLEPEEGLVLFIEIVG